MPMSALIAVTGLLTVAAITPGPNNLMVLRAAARGGVFAAVPAISGILLGGLALLLLALAGAAFASEPRLRLLITLGGGGYLIWLGYRIAFHRNESAATQSRAALPTSMLKLAGFQFLNPKSWVMVLTTVAAVAPLTAVRTLSLFALFIAVPLVCLSLWAVLGHTIVDRMASPTFRRRFDRTMGLLLIASAVWLLLA